MLENLVAGSGKNAIGEIKDPAAVFEKGSLEKLDAIHSGVFGIILFDALVDTAIAAYLETGSLGDDVGPNMMILFERSKVAGDILPLAAGESIRIETENPTNAFARALFPKSHLVLPGIVFLRRLSEPGSAVYVPIESGRVRETLGIVGTAIAKSADPDSFATDVGIALAARSIPYSKSAPIAVKERVVALLMALWGMRRDLAALIGPVLKTVSGRG